MLDDYLRIFAGGSPCGPGPRRPQADAASIAEPSALLPSAPGGAAEAGLQRIVDGLPHPGESVQRAFDRKERELCALFAGLHPDERKALHRRLVDGGSDDRAVAAISRLSSDRRRRVIAALASFTRQHGGAR